MECPLVTPHTCKWDSQNKEVYCNKPQLFSVRCILWYASLQSRQDSTSHLELLKMLRTSLIRGMDVFSVKYSSIKQSEIYYRPSILGQFMSSQHYW